MGNDPDGAATGCHLSSVRVPPRRGNNVPGQYGPAHIGSWCAGLAQTESDSSAAAGSGAGAVGDLISAIAALAHRTVTPGPSCSSTVSSPIEATVAYRPEVVMTSTPGTRLACSC